MERSTEFTGLAGGCGGVLGAAFDVSGLDAHVVGVGDLALLTGETEGG